MIYILPDLFKNESFFKKHKSKKKGKGRSKKALEVSVEIDEDEDEEMYEEDEEDVPDDHWEWEDVDLDDEDEGVPQDAYGVEDEEPPDEEEEEIPDLDQMHEEIQLLVCLRSFLNLNMYSSFETQTEETLKAFEDELEHFFTEVQVCLPCVCRKPLRNIFSELKSDRN